MADARKMNKEREETMGHLIGKTKVPIYLRLPPFIIKWLKDHSNKTSQSVLTEKALMGHYKIVDPDKKK